MKRIVSFVTAIAFLFAVTFTINHKTIDKGANFLIPSANADLLCGIGYEAVWYVVYVFGYPMPNYYCALEPDHKTPEDEWDEL